MKNIIYLQLIVISLFVACSGTARGDSGQLEQNRVSIMRFDNDLHQYLSNPAAEKEAALKAQYPVLLPAFGRITVNNSDPSTIFSALQDYFAHPMLSGIYSDALRTFEQVDSYEKTLSEANGLIAEHLSGRKLPKLAMHVSGFKENVIVLNSLISISTDKYLGADYGTYNEFFQPFERQQMQARFVPRDYMRAWLISDILQPDDTDETLLAHLVYEGKILYALSVLLPGYDANDLIGYTAQQADWCKEHEKQIWQTIVKQNYLFSKDNMVVTRFINDAPTTSLLSKDSPGKVGCWIGWQLVQQYAKRTKSSLEDILSMDEQLILKESKYNP